MTAPGNLCRRCLLREMTNAQEHYKSVIHYRQTMPKNLRTPDDLYETRLQICKNCYSLENGTCRQCGCCVDIRAARIDLHCPKADAQW